MSSTGSSTVAHGGGGGIIGRGVLLDIAALHGMPWLGEGHEISAAELDDAAKQQGVQLEPGDILMVTWLAPFHSVAMVAMGMWVVDNYDLEDLAQTCERLGRYEFMATIAAIRLKNSTGSPVNPLAVF
jgi:Putative cyclase